eukprot:6223520-Karenia_brevis.AAC.1
MHKRRLLQREVVTAAGSGSHVDNAPAVATSFQPARRATGKTAVSQVSFKTTISDSDLASSLQNLADRRATRQVRPRTSPL